MLNLMDYLRMNMKNMKYVDHRYMIYLHLSMQIYHQFRFQLVLVAPQLLLRGGAKLGNKFHSPS